MWPVQYSCKVNKCTIHVLLLLNNLPLCILFSNDQSSPSKPEFCWLHKAIGFVSLSLNETMKSSSSITLLSTQTCHLFKHWYSSYSWMTFPLSNPSETNPKTLTSSSHLLHSNVEPFYILLPTQNHLKRSKTSTHIIICCTILNNTYLSTEVAAFYANCGQIDYAQLFLMELF